MRRTLKPISILLFINLLLVFLWFWRGWIFAGGEEGIPFYDLDKTFSLYSFAWRDSDAGFPNLEHLTRIPFFFVLKVLYNAGVSNILLQAATFLLLMITGTFSIYFLLKVTVVHELKAREDRFYRWVPLLGAIFYLLNPFSMVQVWGRGLYTQFFPFALFPLFLLLTVLFLQKRKIIYGITALVSSFVLSGSFGNLSYVLSFWLLILLYFLFYVLTHRRRKELLYSTFSLVFLSVGFLILHLWWLSYSVTYLDETIANRSASIGAALGTLRGISGQYDLGVILRLLHTFILEAKLYGEVYVTPGFMLISWITPFVAVFSFKSFQKIVHFRFYLYLFLVSLFVVLGSNPPLGRFFEWLFINLTPLQAFRNPYEKMGLNFVVAYTPFFAIGVIEVSRLAYKFVKSKFSIVIPPLSIVIAILVLAFGVYAWPMWTGQFSGGVEFESRIKVPSYYKEANAWLKTKSGEFRVIHLPLKTGDGAVFKWERPYRGTDPTEYMFKHSSISKNVGFNKVYYNVLLERFGSLEKGVFGPDPDITDSEFKSDYFYEELAKLNIGYIVLHRDLDETGIPKGSSEFQDYLSSQEKIKRVKTFGQLDIYSVDIGDVKHIYSPNAETQFRKVNPTLYYVDISAEDSPVDLYFLELFDDGWEAFVDGKKIEEHGMLFSYANLWKISKEGNYTAVIKYVPHSYITQGMRYALLVFGMLIIFSMIYVFKRRSFSNSSTHP